MTTASMTTAVNTEIEQDAIEWLIDLVKKAKLKLINIESIIERRAEETLNSLEVDSTFDELEETKRRLRRDKEYRDYLKLFIADMGLLAGDRDKLLKEYAASQAQLEVNGY